MIKLGDGRGVEREIFPLELVFPLLLQHGTVQHNVAGNFCYTVAAALPT